MKFRTTALMLATALAIAPAAKADTYNVSFSGSFLDGSPTTLNTTVEATNQGNGSYLVTSLDGFSYTCLGSTYNSATLVGTYGYTGDSLIYPGDAYPYSYKNCMTGTCVPESGTSALDYSGLLFSVSGTYVGLNLGFDSLGNVVYDSENYYYLNADGSASYSNSIGTLAITSANLPATPEPGSWLLMISGFLALLFAGRRQLGFKS